MTGDDLNVLKDSVEALTQAIVNHQALSDRVNTLVSGQAGMSTTLLALQSVTTVQLEKLFEKHDAHETRLTDVERTYVERTVCQRIHDKALELNDEFNLRNREEHEGFRANLNKLSLRMAWVGGAVALGTAALNWVATNWQTIHAAGTVAGVRP